MTTSEVIAYESPAQVRKDLDVIRAQLLEVLPSQIDAERFLRIIAKAVIESPKLMACTRLSLLASIHEAAQLGLEPGVMGSAYLVPYKMRRQVGSVWQTVHEAKLIPGYRGLTELAYRSGEIRAIESDVWRLRDGFDYERTRQPNPIVHRPFIPNPTDPPEERDRGPIVGAYMLATLRSGHVVPEVMYADEIEAIRKRSRAADDGPWVTDPSEMARKTVIRRGSKHLPLSTDLRRALELESEAEQDAVAPVATTAQVNRATAMLLERASAQAAGQGDTQSAGGSSDTTEDGNGRPGASGEVSSGRKPPEKAPKATRATCGLVNADLGPCSSKAGHDGPHRNERGVWPREAVVEQQP